MQWKNLPYNNLKDWDKDFKSLERLVKKYIEDKESCSTSTKLLEFLKLEKRLDTKYFNLSMYLLLSMENKKEVNPLKEREGKLQHLEIKYFSAVSDFERFMRRNKSKLNNYYKMKKLKHFHPRIRMIIYNDNKNKKAEMLLDRFGNMPEKFYQMFSSILNNHISYKPVKHEGKSYRLNSSNIGTKLNCLDKNLRKKIYKSMMTSYVGSLENEFSDVLNSHIQSQVGRSMLEKNNVIDYMLEDDKLKEKDVIKVIDAVYSRTDVVEKFIKLRKKQLGIRSYEISDEHAPYANTRIDVKKALNTFTESLYYYRNDSFYYFQELKKQKNIFICKKPNVAIPYSGYSMSYGNQEPYVFVKYDKNDLYCAVTLAHELGHAYHQSKLNNYNDFWNRDTSLIIHESVAFIHEIIYMKHLIEESNNAKQIKNYKMTLAGFYFNHIFKYGSLVRMEKYLYNQVQKRHFVRPDKISEKYEQFTKEMYGNSLKDNEFIKKGWINNQKLLWDFYLFKYLLAFCFATHIADGLFNGDQDIIMKYNKMLKMGDTHNIEEFFQMFGFSYRKINVLIDQAIDKFQSLLMEIE